MVIKVESYAGYRSDERPMRFVMSGRVYEASYFRVVASDGNCYVLYHDEKQDLWSLEAFRAS